MSNLHPPSWPDGNDVEVMTFAALEQAHREAAAPHEREHTTPFLWDQPERFRVGNVRVGDRPRPVDDATASPSTTRTTTRSWPRCTRRSGGQERPVFPLAEVLALLEERPELRETNARYAGVNWYRHHLADLRTVPASATRLRRGRRSATPAGGIGHERLSGYAS